MYVWLDVLPFRKQIFKKVNNATLQDALFK